jgi:predicted Zn finger-like uncharacterized protein
MDVRCPQCQTLYELEDSQLKSAVVTLKCSQCQHVFRIETRQSTLVQENQRRWMIRLKKTGDILYITGFDVLHQWIMEGKVKKRDEISRTGKRWTVLSEIGEFMPIFQVQESISNLIHGSPEESQIVARMPEPPAADLAPSPGPAQDLPSVLPGPIDERERVRTSIQYGGASPKTEEVTQRARPSLHTPLPPSPNPSSRRSTGPQPGVVPQVEKDVDQTQDAWELGSVPSTTFDQERTLQTPMPQSSFPWALVVVVLLILGAAYAFVFHKDDIMALVGPSKEVAVVPLGETKIEPTAPTNPDIIGMAREGGDKARDEALGAVQSAHEKTFAEVFKAMRPGMDRAIGVATEEAEVAAEGGGIEYKLAEANKALKNGRAQSALGIFQEVVAKEGRNAAAITGMGWALLELGRHDEAATQFRRATELDPKLGDALIGLGSAERQRGNLQEAMKAYDLYLGRHPRGDKVSIAQYQIDALRRQLGL